MKKIPIYFFTILFCLILTGNVVALDVPQRTGIVNDYANAINYNHKSKITRLIQNLWQKTGVELAVMTVKSLEGEEIEDYANRVFNTWGIGDKNSDNGVLFLVAIEDEEVRIEVGYGLEEILTDGVCGAILDVIVPFMKNEWYAQAIYRGVLHIINQIAIRYDVEIGELPNLDELKIKADHQYSPLARLLKILFSLLFFTFLFGTRMGLFSYLLYGSMGSNVGYWSSGYRGGFGGGFGGFTGGGASGGGGASRSW